MGTTAWSCRTTKHAHRKKPEGRPSSARRWQTPWKGVKDRKRFGVGNLVDHVSGLMVRLIEKALPQLLRDINLLLRECGDGLRALPKQTHFDSDADVSAYILLRIAEFCTSFKNAIAGDPASAYRDLIHQNRAHYATLACAIKETAPDLRPWLDKKQFADPKLGLGKGSGAMDLTDVKAVIKEVTTWELPGHIPFEATKILIERVTRHWVQPSTECFERVAENTKRVVDKLVDAYFGQFHNLKEHVRQHIYTKFETVFEAAEESVRIVLHLDTGVPLFTQNAANLQEETHKWNTMILTYNGNSSYRTKPPTAGEFALETSADNRDAMLLMARARAYCEVASKRIIDTVPLTVEHQLLHRLADGLLGTLIGHHEREQPEAKRAMLDEDEGVAEERKALKARKERLLKIQDRFGRWEGEI
ncbi:hypothetical protein HDZ31DRAFT_64624 [Schizophyllum fasciatum]